MLSAWSISWGKKSHHLFQWNVITKSLKVGNCCDQFQRIPMFQAKAIYQRNTFVSLMNGFLKTLEFSVTSYQPLNFLPYLTLSMQYFIFIQMWLKVDFTYLCSGILKSIEYNLPTSKNNNFMSSLPQVNFLQLKTLIGTSDSSGYFKQHSISIVDKLGKKNSHHLFQEAK